MKNYLIYTLPHQNALKPLVKKSQRHIHQVREHYQQNLAFTCEIQHWKQKVTTAKTEHYGRMFSAAASTNLQYSSYIVFGKESWGDVWVFAARDTETSACTWQWPMDTAEKRSLHIFKMRDKKEWGAGGAMLKNVCRNTSQSLTAACFWENLLYQKHLNIW